MTTVLLTVPDISCEHCARTIRQALAPVEGIHELDVDIPAKQVRITYDAHVVGTERMKEILGAEGYPVAP
ncbi:MAG TPA: heavy-metal-associated domain-containing protein [bacterium]|nr:heavy-metal-associated domain-containing protein [bacterium]